jgi:hypothetical protein
VESTNHMDEVDKASGSPGRAGYSHKVRPLSSLEQAGGSQTVSTQREPNCNLCEQFAVHERAGV